MTILKEQIKIIRETDFATEPTYNSNDVIVVDATDWSLSPDHGIITQETLTTAGVTAALPGGYTLSGSTTVPARMSQIDKLNEIGLGQATYKSVNYNDAQGNLVYTMNTSIALPSQKFLPTFTVYHLYPEPESVDTVFGTVFTNMKTEFSTDKVLTYSYDVTAVRNETLRANIPNDDRYKNEPMPIQDYVRALDATLYADLMVVQYDTTNDKFIDSEGNEYTPLDENNDNYYEKIEDSSNNKFSLIDVVPIQESGITPNDIYDEVRYLAGRRIHGVSTVSIDMKVENAGNDAFRLGTRFANEYPIRKVVKQDYTGSMTIDFAATQSADIDSIELYNEFINGARTEDIIRPTETGIGKLSVVVKVGSAYDMKPTTAQSDKRVPSAFGMKSDDPLMYNSDINTPYLGAPNRCQYILPNVVLEKADKKDATGQLKTVDLTIRMLPDAGLFKDYVMVDSNNNETQLADLRAFTVSWLK